MSLLKFFIVTIFLLIGTSVWICHADAAVEGSIERRIKRFQDRYKIPIIYKNITPMKGRNQFSLVSSKEYELLDRYLKLFEKEISKYPDNFFKYRDVRGIILVKKLFSNEKPAEGIYGWKRRIIFLDISRYSHNEALQRHSIHHELFHMMALQIPDYEPFEDQKWISWNHKDFSYGEQKYNFHDQNPYNRHAPNKPGFVTYYAMASVEEDKAEVFACLMQKKHRRLIEQWKDKDEGMRQKIHAMKDFVAYYFPDMNAAYWEQLKD